MFPFRLAAVGLACGLSVASVGGGCSQHPHGGSSQALSDGRQADRPPDDSQLAAQQLNPAVRSVGNVETVAVFNGPMPTGVTVSQSGRVFVNFPRWGDNVEFTVAELKDGRPVAFPDAEINQFSADKVADRLVSVQSVVVDPADRLWMLDTGGIEFGPVAAGGPKLVAVDLKTNQVVKTIRFPGDVALATTYLNDVRFDLTRGKAGVAFITDSGAEGPNGIIVVDLDSGHSWRKLSGHPVVRADPNFRPVIPGDPLVTRPLMNRPEAGTARPMTLGADGIALSNDGRRLYFCPLSSQRLYSVSTDALLDPKLTDDQVAGTLHQLGRDYASDGLESDAAGDLYLTDYQNNAIHRRTPDDKDTIIVQGPRMIWPDTLCVANDGYLYFTANQLDRQKMFHEGQDLRRKPYYLFRMKIDARPVSMGPPLRVQ